MRGVVAGGLISLRSSGLRPSQKTLRIDIDIELDRTVLLRRRREPLPQIGREIEIARRLDQQPEAMPAADQRERRFGGAEDAHLVLGWRGAGESARMSLGGVLIGAGDDDRGEAAERRIVVALADFDLGGVERLAILRDQGAHHGMLGLVRLQIATADAGVAAGAADDLVQKLKGALGGARVAVTQAQISVDDADQIEHREVMAFRYKL